MSIFFSRKLCIFSLLGVVSVLPLVSARAELPQDDETASAVVSVTSSAYVNERLESKQNKDDTNLYKVGQNGAWVDASNAITVDTTYLKKTADDETGAVEIAIDGDKVTTSGESGLDDTSTNLVQEKAVAEAIADKQVVPSSGVANGKVLTYTGSDANANVSAAYITVPVATAAPSTVTPTGFVEMWVEEGTSGQQLPPEESPAG